MNPARSVQAPRPRTTIASERVKPSLPILSQMPLAVGTREALVADPLPDAVGHVRGLARFGVGHHNVAHLVARLAQDRASAVGVPLHGLRMDVAEPLPDAVGHVRGLARFGVGHHNVAHLVARLAQDRASAVGVPLHG